MNDELEAALARAEAAEAKVKKLAEELEHCDIMRAAWLSLFNQAELQRDEALARAEEAEAEVKRLEALELARANANARAERAERERATSDEVREMWFKKWCNADDERRNAERQRDEAFTAGAEARALLSRCHEHLHNLTAIIPGNDLAYQKTTDLMAAIRALPIPAQEVGLVAHCVNNCSRQGPYGDVACGDCEMRPTSKTP